MAARRPLRERGKSGRRDIRAKLPRGGRISNRELLARLLQKGVTRMDFSSRALLILVFLQAFSLTPV